jgi:hypothetical protein
MKLLSIGIALLLLACLADMPYGYFQFVRFASAAFFSYAAYHENEKGSKELAIVFLVLAILFQPFIKISLGRTIWNIVDVIVSLGLFGYAMKGSSGKSST